MPSIRYAVLLLRLWRRPPAYGRPLQGSQEGT